MEKIKCKKCRKKICWTYLECRCGNFYCNKHIYPFEHECEFDHKKYNKDNIKKNNIVVEKESDKPCKRNTFRYK